MLTRTSVHERERLLKESPGLIEPLEILVPVYSDHGPGKQALNIGLAIYGLMGHEQHHHYYKAEAYYEMVPGILEKNLVGGFSFFDAQVADSRLVMRLINEAVFAGGTALNYTTVKEIIRDQKRRVVGIVLEDSETGDCMELETRTVIKGQPRASPHGWVYGVSTRGGRDLGARPSCFETKLNNFNGIGCFRTRNL